LNEKREGSINQRYLIVSNTYETKKVWKGMETIGKVFF